MKGIDDDACGPRDWITIHLNVGDNQKRSLTFIFAHYNPIEKKTFQLKTGLDNISGFSSQRAFQSYGKVQNYTPSVP